MNVLGFLLWRVEEEEEGSQKALSCVSETVRIRAETGYIGIKAWKQTCP